MALDRSRFHHLLPDEKIQEVHTTIVGLGNLGLQVFLSLVQMGLPRFRLIDKDEVGAENVATQGYHEAYLGWSKPQAALAMAAEMCGELVTRGEQVRLEESDVAEVRASATDILIVAPDNIATRKAVFTKWRRSAGLLVDARMALESFELFFIKPRSAAEDPKREEYAKTLEETDHLRFPCSARSIGYTGRGVAAFVSPVIRHHLLGKPVPYVIFGDLGRGMVKTFWRAGEAYQPDELPDS